MKLFLRWKEHLMKCYANKVDAITKEEKYFVTDCLYSELHNAFMGYGAYPNTRVVAFKEKDKPYMPEKRTRKSRRFRKRLTSS